MASSALTAEEVKTRLRSRHPAHPPNGMGSGPWTTVEEWRGIDLLAVSAWSSLGAYERVGYEVKVTRADLRRELLRPAKRLPNVLWTNRFFLAVPRGLLTDDELQFEEPDDWTPEDFKRDPCPRERGLYDYPGKIDGRRVKCVEYVPVPSVLRYEHESYAQGWGGRAWTDVPCRVCGGIGTIGRSRVEREAPTVWVPRDVGLVVVGRGTEEIRESPRRKTVPTLSPGELGQLLRWVSSRPDPRHHAV